MSLPRGWKLEQPENDPNHVGTLSVFRRADTASVAQAKKRLTEVHIKDDQQGLLLTDKSGQEWQVVRSFFDPVDPSSVGVEAFVVRDGMIVPLRPVGWEAPVESRYLGESGGRKAGPREPLPQSGIF
ncbi:MAG: hypothetical protein H0U59_06840 [Gemmatimonadaceae bacterium]|nr:hypothetical protein [Gemmatimonadaceae bacterium]